MDAADAKYFADLERQFVRDKVPAVVRDSIRQYIPPPGYRISRKKTTNTSIAFSWGVRLVQLDNPKQLWWVCRASDVCRDPEREGPDRTACLINMMQGKTSKVTEHLKKYHDILSYKTEKTEDRKRRHEEIITAYENSDIYKQRPGHMMVLLETMKIVRNNLPFCSVEKKESTIIRKLCYKEALQATLNAKVVVHTIMELYVSCKREVLGLIDAARGQRGGYFSVVTDFWTCEVQNKKYIGIRLYMVDATYTFRSVLLGTRQFDPPFGDRDRSCANCIRGQIDPCPHSKHKIRYPFRRWITNVLRDFRITRGDLFGSTTDAGSDVKWMMGQGFKLRWEWCLSHLSNAATKAGCGLADDPTKSRNKAMTKLHKKITLTVFQTKNVSVLGNLFEELCGSISEDKSKQLINYRAHRFLGLTRVVERILLKWEVLTAWYAAREAKAVREGSNVPTFPLDGHKRDLIQLLSLLKPIADNNVFAQTEAPLQVDVLLGLFRLRMKTLNPDTPLVDYRSLPPPELPEYFQVDSLTQTIRVTRQLLCDAFHVRYFRRYTDKKAIEKCSYVFEMQMALHPNYKDFSLSLKEVVLLSNTQYGTIDGDPEQAYNTIVAKIEQKLLNEMRAIAGPSTAAATPTQTQQRLPQRDAENLAMFGRAEAQVQAQVQTQVQTDAELLAELRLWQADASVLKRDADGVAEHVTTYWGRKATQLVPRYNILPTVARALFAVPSTSCQLERDFGMSGRQLTPERGRTGAANVDMCAFLNCNHDYVDLTQCSAIPESDRDEHLPSCTPVAGNPLDEDEDEFGLELATLAPQIFSNTSLYEGEESEPGEEEEYVYDEMQDSE